MAELQITPASGNIIWNPASIEGDYFRNTGREVVLIKTAKLSEEQTPIIKNIVSVDSVEGVTALRGTAFSALNLPKVVSVMLDGDLSAYLKVTWAKGTYDENTEGSYTLEGVIGLNEYLSNTSDLKASVKVTVSTHNIATVLDFPPKTFVKGTTVEDMAKELPKEVKVIYEDNMANSLAVVWDTITDEQASNVGKFTLAGAITLDSASANTNDLKTSIDIVIQDNIVVNDIKSVAALTNIEVETGTEFSAIPFPQTVQVTMDNNSTKNLAVTWEENSSYDKAVEATYTFSGIITLDATVTNTTNVKASVDVIVAAPAPAPTNYNLKTAVLAAGEEVNPPEEEVEEILVTVPSMTKCNYGFIHNFEKTIARGVEARLGVFNPARFNDERGQVNIKCSVIEDVSIAVMRN